MSTGLVIGVAGASLTDGSFTVDAGTARVGADGERKTAAILDPFTQTTSATVLHDLMVSARGYRSNIDHVVVSGSHVLIVDSKVWLPGFYWTLNGTTRRGMSRFATGGSGGRCGACGGSGKVVGTGEATGGSGGRCGACGGSGKVVGPADSKAVDMVADILGAHLEARAITATLDTPVITVWPSRKSGAVRTWAYRPPRGRVFHGHKLARAVARFATHGPADERIITALASLVTRPDSVRRVSG